jgi:hypothetical protein
VEGFCSGIIIPAPVVRTLLDGGWRTQWKDDGLDYRRLLKDFQDGRVLGGRLATISPFRTVYRVESGGRVLVVKFDRDVLKRERKTGKRLFSYLFGTQYSRFINMTFRALMNGCPVVQDVYLDSEKMKGRLCEEAWSIAEYVPGHSFGREEYVEGAATVCRKPGPWLQDVGEALADPHDYGLASIEPIISNFIVTPEGRVKVIDLSLNGPMFVCQADDVLKLRRNYGGAVPVRRLRRKVLIAALGSWNRVQVWLRRLKERAPTALPDAIWEDLDSFPERPGKAGKPGAPDSRPQPRRLPGRPGFRRPAPDLPCQESDSG